MLAVPSSRPGLKSVVPPALGLFGVGPSRTVGKRGRLVWASCRYSRSLERPVRCLACRPCSGSCAWPYASRTMTEREWPRCSATRR